MDVKELLINTLKSDSGYENWKRQFYSYVHSRDRTQHPVNYYLIYDLDDNAYSIKSEYTIYYNMIVLQTAQVPAKKEVNKSIEIKEYEYK